VVLEEKARKGEMNFEQGVEVAVAVAVLEQGKVVELGKGPVVVA